MHGKIIAKFDLEVYRIITFLQNRERRQIHRSQTLLWYNQCNGGYGRFVTAGTISFNGVFTLTRKTERIDGMKMSITFCVYIVFK